MGSFDKLRNCSRPAHPLQYFKLLASAFPPQPTAALSTKVDPIDKRTRTGDPNEDFLCVLTLNEKVLCVREGCSRESQLTHAAGLRRNSERLENRREGDRPPRQSGAACSQGCQMAKCDPFLSLDCARVEGVGAQSKERKRSNFAV